jgi:uncharacterized SAM-binding protein YcdF (DUF218 family)
VNRPALVAAARAATAAIALYLLYGFLDFGNFPTPGPAQLAGVRVAVALGGGEQRISAGLRLIDAGAIDRLFISGDNLNNYNSFVSFYAWRNPELRDVGRLLECCVEWSRKAQSTVENATETRCWLARSGYGGPILLITSAEHMGRALFIFSKVLPGRPIIAYPAPDPWHPKSGEERLRDVALEYVRLVSTRAYDGLVSLVGGRLPGRDFC